MEQSDQSLLIERAGALVEAAQKSGADAADAVAVRGMSLGVQMREVRVIPDIRKTIVDTLNECRAQFDYIFTTGFGWEW